MHPAIRYGSNMGKLRHIAIAADDPEATAATLRDVFDLEEVGRHDSSLARGVFLSDGTINLAVLKFHTDQIGKGLDYRGPHHFGFLVDDLDGTRQDLLDAGAEILFDKPDDPSATFFEVKVRTPDGLVFDIADHPWLGSRA
jgi:catechol 2,3-dioxygenase-like lactoylglutathione lyase family enzyme